MNKDSYIFTQLCQFLPRDYFEYLVKKYQGNIRDFINGINTNDNSQIDSFGMLKLF